MNHPQRNSAILTKGKGLTHGPRTYIVFGVMRGGTSMVAGVMRGLGVYMGPDIAAENHESAAFAHQSIPEMRKAITACNELQQIWGWKNPNAADYVDRLWQDLRNPHLICVFRDSVSNGQGLNRWHPIGSIQGVHQTLLQQQKNLGLLLMRQCPSLLISYEKATRHPEQFVMELSDWVGISADHNKFDFTGFMSAGSYKNISDFQR